MFDLRPMFFLDHVAFVPSLMTIDITSCDMEKNTYMNYLHKAKNLKRVAQPLVARNKPGGEKLAMVDLPDLVGNRNPFTVIHINKLPPYPPPGSTMLTGHRNPYLVVVSDSFFNVE